MSRGPYHLSGMSSSLRTWTILALSTVILAVPSSSWRLPEKMFLEEFAIRFQREGISLFLPDKNMDQPNIAKMIRYFNGIDMPMGAVYEKKVNFSKEGYERRPKNLYMTTASMYNSLNFNSTVRFLEHNFIQRKRTDKEMWLLGTDIEMDIYSTGDLFRLGYPFNGVHLDLDDEMYIYQMDTAGKSGKYQIYEVYKIYDEGPPQLNRVGTWDVETKTLDFSGDDKNIRRRDLKGLNFRLMTKDALPYVGLKKNADGSFLMGGEDNKQVYLENGMFVEPFMEMSRLLNFTYTAREPPDNQYGAIKADGTWNGMVGQLAIENADIAVTDFTITQARSTVMTFSTPMDQIFNSIFFPNPSNSLSYFAYLNPFANNSWYMLLVWVFAASPIIHVLLRYGELDKNINEFTLPKVFVLVAGAMTQRGYSCAPGTWKGKIAFTSFMLSGVLIYFHWEAMLISYLATRTVIYPFNNLQELYESDFQFFTLPNSAMWDSFKYGDDLWQKIFKDMFEPNTEWYNEYAGSTEKQIEWILLDSEHALYANYYQFSVFDEFVNCKMVVMPDGKYDFKPYAIGYQKDSPYREILDFHINMMRETGTLENIVSSYRGQPQECPDFSGSPLPWQIVFTAFGVLMFGAFLSVCLFITEHLLGKSKVGKLLMNGYNYRVVPPEFHENVWDGRNDVLTIEPAFKESKQYSVAF